MTFFAEEDSARPELRHGSAEVVRFVPKLNGVQADFAGISAATWTLRDCGSVVLSSGSQAASSVTLGARTAAYYDIAIPAQAVYEENAILDITWTPAGGQTQSYIILVDIVRSPLGDLVSLSDMKTIRPDIGADLERIGRLYGETTSQAAEERAAAVFAGAARAKVQRLLQERADDDERIRPHQIISQRELANAEAYFAVALFYEGIADAHTEGEDGASELYRHFNREAMEVFRSMRIVYDTSEDAVPDASETTSLSRSYTMRRVQG